jgi:hypothetical protein
VESAATLLPLPSSLPQPAGGATAAAASKAKHGDSDSSGHAPLQLERPTKGQGLVEASGVASGSAGVRALRSLKQLLG